MPDVLSTEPSPDLERDLHRADVLVCGGTGCHSSDSRLVAEALKVEVARAGLEPEVRVVPTGCRGFCSMGPIMMIYPEGILYCQVQPGDVQEIVSETLVKGRVVQRLCYRDPAARTARPGEADAQQGLPYYRDIPFYRKQMRIVLRNCGLIDPDSIDEYIAREGYRALAKALTGMSPDDVIQEMKDSGLRGRGGAGFLTGLKWEFAARAKGSPKYVICNADEGDPGAFMDRSILEGDPHSVVEGMAIAAYAIGAHEGYIYCRAEYPLAVQRLENAIRLANDYGLLGADILGSGFSFDLRVKEGAGAFVCGEETALIGSIEGKRGEPRPRPPFPAAAGLWHKPSNVNNVKSYAMSPQIILNGAEWFRGIGPAKSPGTAIFALTGKINNTGLIEVPMGIPLGEIIFDVGGGVPNGKTFKAVQTGGPLGGCLPASALNTPVDFDALTAAGATMGSGGMIVVDEDTCMVEFARYFLQFATAESCGKCVPCRIGGQRLLEVLTRISEGRGAPGDLEQIRYISENMRESALCALGQLTPGPVMSALRFFGNEFARHIEDHVCEAGQCKALVRARCINGCPAGVEIPAYLALVAQGRYAEGLEIHRQRNPFALICGRVCPAFCERRCRRGDIDEPISIRLVKRFMADHEVEHPWTPSPRGPSRPRRVAIVGAGPAGLTAALRLAQDGYGVTVFEKLPVAGGMMTVGIPEYRLPRAPLYAEIANIERAGVEIRCNQSLGDDFTVDDLLERDGFSAVVLAIGAHKSRKLGIPGEEHLGVLHGTDFLRAVALMEAGSRKQDVGPGKQDVGHRSTADNPQSFVAGKRVAVIGGGNVALDAARTAWRLGASEVHVIYRRQREAMPAHVEEVRAACDEGIRFHFLANPVRVLAKSRAVGGPESREVGEAESRDAGCTGDDEHAWIGLEIQRQRLGDFDNGGRRRPVPIDDDPEAGIRSVYVLNVDVVISAIGQTTDTSWMRGTGIGVSRSGTFVVDEALATSRPGVFAAGDAVSGPATVVEAVAQGNLVAVAVDRWLQDGTLARPRHETPRPDIAQLYSLDDYADARRPHVPELALSERKPEAAPVPDSGPGSGRSRAPAFREVELGYDEHTAREEAKRCLRCDLEWMDYMKLPRPAGGDR
jgi:NADH-quinone oxidoreductase subunit F